MMHSGRVYACVCNRVWCSCMCSCVVHQGTKTSLPPLELINDEVLGRVIVDDVGPVEINISERVVSGCLVCCLSNHPLHGELGHLSCTRASGSIPEWVPCILFDFRPYRRKDQGHSIEEESLP